MTHTQGVPPELVGEGSSEEGTRSPRRTLNGNIVRDLRTVARSFMCSHQPRTGYMLGDVADYIERLEAALNRARRHVRLTAQYEIDAALAEPPPRPLFPEDEHRSQIPSARPQLNTKRDR